MEKASAPDPLPSRVNEVLENFKRESNIVIAKFRNKSKLIEKNFIKNNLILLSSVIGLIMIFIPMEVISIIGTLICLVDMVIVSKKIKEQKEILEREKKAKMFEENIKLENCVEEKIKKNLFTKRKVIVDEVSLDDYFLIEEIYQRRKDDIQKYYINNKLNRIVGKELSSLQIEILKLIIEDDMNKNKSESFQMTLK